METVDKKYRELALTRLRLENIHSFSFEVCLSYVQVRICVFHVKYKIELLCLNVNFKRMFSNWNKVCSIVELDVHF